ncbi:MAG: DUF342 domain-containing protein [Chitinispirillaceae bacterium]|nr:DUF342 domain-containing protein [Chitinispirillaceae bacterium]
MSDISLQCEADGSCASFTIAEGSNRKFAVRELHALLEERKIVFGIDEEALERIASGALRGRVAVAIGKPAEPGVPGRLEWFIDLSKVGKPRELEDGSVNLRDLQFDLNVRKGDSLVRHIAPVPGKPGSTVFGTPVFSPPPADVVITVGKGTDHDANDPACIVATIDGAVTFNGHLIEVHNRKVIKGDINYETGNVYFNGDLEIAGSVRAGFSVSASGDIVIGGNVEDAEITSGGSVIVQGGVTGSGSGRITCSGFLRVHHAAQFAFSADKEVIIKEDALHCTIMSEETVTAKAIVGGSISAFAISVEIAGSAAETRTILDVARTARLRRERYDLLKRFGSLTVQRADHYEKMFFLVRDGMDEKGFLRYGDMQTLALLKDTTLESITSTERIRERIEKIDELENMRQGDSTVSIGIAYPNTVIRIGSEERLLKEEKRNLFLTVPKK